MKRELSIYLDLLRAGAAFTVFCGHLSWARLSGGFLWWMQPYGHASVMVFFVLSGFVIQYTLTARESSLRDYSVARLARLYSVVLPALLLTFIFDLIGSTIKPELYLLDRQTEPALRLLAGATFTAQSWDWNLSIFSNDAFWSLPYEFWYYFLFGCACLLDGRRRIIGLAFGCVMAGPSILRYLPIWLAGAFAYRASQKIFLSKTQGWALFSLSAAAFAWVMHEESLGHIHHATVPQLPPGYSPMDYVIGALVAVNLFAASYIELPLAKIGKLLTYVASFTFSLYLLHLPLIHLGAALIPSLRSVELRGTCIGIFTLCLVYLIGLVTEHRKREFANAIRWLLTLHTPADRAKPRC